MKIMQPQLHNPHRHPWREAIRSQIPTFIVATLMLASFISGLSVGSRECDFNQAYTNSIEKQK
jgi:hypothetical protein